MYPNPYQTTGGGVPGYGAPATGYASSTAAPSAYGAPLATSTMYGAPSYKPGASTYPSVPSRTLRLQARDPRVEIVWQKEDAIKFVLSDTDTSVANALRRVMIAEVPTMAIDLVEVLENSTVLHDEFIVHRLGLLPLRVATSRGVDQFIESQNCQCSSVCDHCSVRFDLDVVNNGPEETKTVYSSDLITQREGIEVVGYSSKEEQALMSRDEGRGIVIAKLGIGQRLKVSAWAKKGIGKMHAKWSPVAIASYTFEPRVILNDARLDEITELQRREFVLSCPVKVYSFDERSKKVMLANEPACFFCNECVKKGREFKEKGDDDNVVAIETKPNRFVFTVETVGSLRPEEVVLNALRRLQTLVNEVKRECQELITAGKEQSDNMDGVAHLVFKDTGGFI